MRKTKKSKKQRVKRKGSAQEPVSIRAKPGKPGKTAQMLRAGATSYMRST